MAKSKPSFEKIPVTKLSLFSWVLQSDMKLQLLLLGVILVTVFARVLPLELQKKIINEAISFKKADLLLTYCGLFLAAVVVSGALKYVISIIQTVLGQQALAGIRNALFSHILTLPINFFRKTQAGMVVSSLVTEIAPAGDFVGMALAVPITNLLTLLAFGTYLLYLNWIMACISLAIYPIILLIVPQLQKRTNKANKQRVDVTRDMSSRIAETVTGIHEVHGNGAYSIENRKFAGLVDSLRQIRVRWNLFKMGTKTLNNFMVNLAPFTLFLVGGYLIIQGQFDIGSLVAFLSAQEKLYDPWKELMEFYQVYQDATVRYTRTMEYFDFHPEHRISIEGRAPYELENRIDIENLDFVVDGRIHLLRGINLNIRPGEHMALVGFSGSGKSTLALCVGQLYKYTGGSLKIGGKEVAELSKRDIVNNIGFVSQHPFIFTGTIRENLLYSCESLQESGEEQKALPSLDDMIAVLQQSGIFVDVLRFGLNTVLARGEQEELEKRIINVRRNFRDDFGEELSDIVEFFSENQYLMHAPVAANLVFGATRDPAFSGEKLAGNDYFLEFLDEVQLTNPLLTLGANIADATIDILGSLPPDSVFFEQSPIPADQIEDYKSLLRRIDTSRIFGLSDEDRASLLKLALGFIPGKHKMVALPAVVRDLLLEGRVRFRDKVSKDYPGTFSFYSKEGYISSQSILENILFGKPKSDTHQAQERISQSIIQLLIEEDLLEKIVEIGMYFQVGSKGDRLSGGQRQKLAIARVLLKKPRILIMDEATSALDNKSQSRIQNLLETRWKGKSTLIAVVHRLDIIKNFDSVAVMKAGKIIEHGSYDQLMKKRGGLYELVMGKH